MLRATLSESVPLQIFVPDGRTDLYARVRVVNAIGGIIATLFPAHLTNGLYSADWTPSIEGYFSAIYELFLDAGLTMVAEYERDAEMIEVSSDKTNLLRLLGLAHENAVLDQQVYGSNGRLQSARLRAYDSAANAQAAGASGLRFTWQISATYTMTNQSETFKIERVP
jgi:hypothetical protein